MSISLPAATRVTLIAAVPVAATLGIAAVTRPLYAQERANTTRINDLELKSNVYPGAPDRPEWVKLKHDNENISTVHFVAFMGRAAATIGIAAGGGVLVAMTKGRSRSVGLGLVTGGVASAATEGVMALSNMNAKAKAS